MNLETRRKRWDRGRREENGGLCCGRGKLEYIMTLGQWFVFRMLVPVRKGTV